MIKKLFIPAAASVVLFASTQYTNCSFKTKAYEELCKEAVKKDISVSYINRFLLSPKAKKRDLESLRLFQPKMIKTHHANEKRANNSLVKFVPQIAAHLEEFKEVYDFTEAKYGVNREIIAAILAKETRLGKIKPTHDAFIVFNTLLLETKPLSKRDRWLISMARKNMVSIMGFCFNNALEPNECSFKSSYAGAVGIPQFMPQNFSYIEGYKEEVGDLSEMSDAIVSTGRFLHKSAGFTKMIDWEKIPDMKKVEDEWYDFDFKYKNASFAYAASKKSGKKYNCFACGRKELGYLSRYVKTIMRYNNSSNYAIGVIRLAYEAHRMQMRN